MGMSCKLKCAENFRRCKCLEKLNCAISGNAVIIEFGGTQYRYVQFGHGIQCIPLVCQWQVSNSETLQFFQRTIE